MNRGWKGRERGGCVEERDLPCSLQTPHLKLLFISFFCTLLLLFYICVPRVGKRASSCKILNGGSFIFFFEKNKRPPSGIAHNDTEIACLSKLASPVCSHHTLTHMRATALLLLALAAASAAAPVLQESFESTDAWASATDERYSGKVKAVKLGDGGAIQVGVWGCGRGGRRGVEDGWRESGKTGRARCAIPLLLRCLFWRCASPARAHARPGSRHDCCSPSAGAGKGGERRRGAGIGGARIKTH